MDPELTHDDAPAAQPAPKSARRTPAPRSEAPRSEAPSSEAPSTEDPDDTPDGAPSRNGAASDTRAPMTRELRARDTAPVDTRPADTRAADTRAADTRAADTRGAETPASRRTADLRGDYRRGDSPRPAETTVPSNIYRARRPAVAALLVIPAVGVGILLVRALAIAGFGQPFHIGGVIASSLGLAALPLLVAGLYGLITGAAHGAEHWGFRIWARPPLAYLLVGIAFAVAAGLAIT